MMNKFFAFTAAALLPVFASALSADEPASKPASVYTQYADWQYQPVMVQDKNASSNVRHQMDATVPLHGPWLTNPAPDGMTITWITRAKCAGGIEYREKGTENWTQKWQVKYGQIDYSKDIQHFHLKGLKPGTEYEYRLLNYFDRYEAPYHMVLSTGREIYSFRTVDPEKQNFKVFITADIHGGLRLCLDPMIDRSGAGDADFFFYMGDNVEDGPYMDYRGYATFGFLDDITRKYGKFKPSVFMRGNHDLWGADCYSHGDLFPSPDERTYQAIRQGPVLFLCLDTMWP